MNKQRLLGLMPEWCFLAKSSDGFRVACGKKEPHGLFSPRLVTSQKCLHIQFERSREMLKGDRLSKVGERHIDQQVISPQIEGLAQQIISKPA